MLKEYLDMIRPYLNGIITDHKTQGEWNIHLTIAIKFISSKDSDETQIGHSKSDNIGIMISNEIEEIIEELFETFLQRYKVVLGESMKGSEFIFDSTDMLYYNLNKISLNRGGSYVDSPKWLKNKKQQ